MDALMKLPFQIYLRPILIALAAGFIVYYLAKHLSVERPSTSRLKKAAGVVPDMASVKVGSTEYRTRLALEKYQIPVIVNEGITRILIVAALGTGGAMAMSGLGAPTVISLAAYVVVWFIVDSQIGSAWTNFKIGIEKEIPTFLTRLSSVVQIEPNVILAVNEVMQTLEEEKPLRGWLEHFLARLQSQGLPALEAELVEAQAISPSLGLAVYEIGKMLEIGGPGYVKAFKIAAENVRGTLQARASGMAKAGSAKSSNQLMIGAVLFSLIFLMGNGSFKGYYADPANQLITAGLIAWMFFGWSFINEFIASRL
ncbi:MAG: hypothetical protein WBM17_17560 [Anaerolineales bacterium]